MSNTKKNIELILNLPGNRKCADCASLVDQDTGWASLNLGVVMCIQCAGLHRSMGTHISKIRSFRLDTNAWTDKITQIFTTIGGNERANMAVWESNLPSFWINPKIDKGSDAIRKEFIRSKYEKQLFLPPDTLRGRINNCLRKMPIQVRQIECDFWVRGDKKYKTKEFLVIHSRWLSRYNGSKKSKAAQQIDLTNFNIIIEENTTGFEEYDGYEFSLYEDTKYIVDHTKEVEIYEQKQTDNTPNVFAHDEPLLRGRIKDFKQFMNTVKDIRSTMAYYRVYDSLFEIDSDDPPLNVTVNDLNLTTTKFLGFAKLGWSKRYFACINGFVYQYKEDISFKPDIIPTAISAWDLQTIDCVLDDNGKRSGAKYAALIMNGNKTVSLKFQSGPEAIVFFTQLKQCWSDTRGKYYVNFSTNPPEISGEANGPQPIQVSGGNGRNSVRQKNSFYMPNPQNGTPLASPKEQDALVLRLIEEYARKKTEMSKKQSATFDVDSRIGGDISSTVTASSSVNGDGYEDSQKFELSESDTNDPLYRQVGGMTNAEKQHFAMVNGYGNTNAQQKQQNTLQINYVGGIPSYQNNVVHQESKASAPLNTLATLTNASKMSASDSDSYHTDPPTMNSPKHALVDDTDALEQALAIEQQMTEEIIQQQSLKEDDDMDVIEDMEDEQVVIDMQNEMTQTAYGEGGEQEQIDMSGEIELQMGNEAPKAMYKAPEPEEQMYNPEVTKKRMSGIVDQMKAALEPEKETSLPQALPEYEIEPVKPEFYENIMPKKAPIVIQRDSQTYTNKSIDGSANVSIAALLRKQKEPEVEVEVEVEPSPEINNQEKIEPNAQYNDADTNDLMQLLEKQTSQPEGPPESEEIKQDTYTDSKISNPNKPEPSPEIVESTNISVSALLNKQNQSEPSPSLSIEPTQPSNINVPAPLLNHHIDNDGNPMLHTRSDSNRSKTVPSVSPKMSLTIQSEVNFMAAVGADVESEDNTESKTQPKPKPKPEPISKPSPNTNTSPNTNLSTKQYNAPNTFTPSNGMNKAGGVAARVSMFQGQNNETISAKANPNKVRNGGKSPKIQINDSNGQMNGTVAVKKRRRKRKRRKPKKKEPIVIHMAHLKVTRWFNIDKKQLAKLSNPSFTNTLQSQLAKYGILSVRKDKKYIKVQISRRIALPQRQEHWTKTMEVLQNKLSGSDLIALETIIND